MKQQAPMVVPAERGYSQLSIVWEDDKPVAWIENPIVAWVIEIITDGGPPCQINVHPVPFLGGETDQDYAIKLPSGEVDNYSERIHSVQAWFEKVRNGRVKG